MATYYFDITEDKINSMSAEDYEALERIQDGEFRVYRARQVICNFMTTEDGKNIPHDSAMNITKKFTMLEMKSFVEQFFNAIKSRAVPNENGSPS